MSIVLSHGLSLEPPQNKGLDSRYGRFIAREYEKYYFYDNLNHSFFFPSRFVKDLKDLKKKLTFPLDRFPISKLNS